MTPEERSILEETNAIARENNEILKKIRRNQKASTFIRLLYWAVVLGLAAGAYYFIEPYVNVLKETYSSLGF